MIYNYAVAVVISMAVTASGVWKVQDWRYAEKEKENAEYRFEAEKRARAHDTFVATRVTEATNSASLQVSVARRDAAGARTELDRLRVSSADLVARTAVSLEACLVGADALRVVFDNCGAEYGRMAEKAQLHAIDAKKLSDAWPE